MLNQQAVDAPTTTESALTPAPAPAPASASAPATPTATAYQDLAAARMTKRAARKKAVEALLIADEAQSKVEDALHKWLESLVLD